MSWGVDLNEKLFSAKTVARGPVSRTSHAREYGHFTNQITWQQNKYKNGINGQYSFRWLRNDLKVSKNLGEIHQAIKWSWTFTSRSTTKASVRYASVNSTCAQPPPPPRADPRELAFFCLGWQIPGGGDSWAGKSPGVGTKKEGKCPVLRQQCNIFYWSHSPIVPF